MQVFNVFSAGFDVLMNDIRSDGSDFDQTIVLNENGIASEITMDNGWCARLMKIAMTLGGKNQC